MRNLDLIFRDTVLKYCPNLKHIVEVGVFEPKDCSVQNWLADKNVRVQLFEPQPELFEVLEDAYGDMPNVQVHPYAIAQDWGQAVLNIPPSLPGNPDAGASAYLDTVSTSPFKVRTGSDLSSEYGVRVETAPFDYFDDGTIDAIHVDTEGCEWFVVDKLVSRPNVISLEMGGPNGYINPYTEDIQVWMDGNNYRVHHELKYRYRSPEDPEGVIIVTDIIYVKKES